MKLYYCQQRQAATTKAGSNALHTWIASRFVMDMSCVVASVGQYNKISPACLANLCKCLYTGGHDVYGCALGMMCAGVSARLYRLLALCHDGLWQFECHGSV